MTGAACAMAGTFRIHASKARSAIPGPSRSLLHTSEPPKSPLADVHICDALESNGANCRVVLDSDEHAWCKQHLNELRQMEDSWYSVQAVAEKIDVFDPDTARERVRKLRLAVDLRRQIRERFFPRGGDTQDYIRWILDLESDLRALADSILISSLRRRPTPELFAGSPNIETRGENIVILRSAIDPKIPKSSIHEAPGDETIIVLKEFYMDLCTEAVGRLYRLVPDLNDGADAGSPGFPTSPTYDGGTEILRAWFRIMVFNDSEAESLEYATQCRSIDEFLHGCYASQLEAYCDFFEKAWRPHAAQYLRIAICAQTLAGREMKSLRLLGNDIPSTSEGLKMRKPSWDILYRWFPTLLTPWTLASICQNFDDYITICKLLMLGLYTEHWFDPKSIFVECPTAIYLGFIPSKKGDFSSVIGARTANGCTTEVEARNYVTGQMAIGDPLTSLFLEELRRRTERLILVVYEGTNADATVYPSEHDIFIRRHRVSTGDNLSHAEWIVDMTLEDVKNDLRMRKSSTYDPIVVDSWQFIIFDRQAGMQFELFDIIQDALLMLNGDPTPRSLAEKVVREIIPASLQDIFLEDMRLDIPAVMKGPSPPHIQYEGNRQRFWETNRTLPSAHEITQPGTQSRNTNRLIRRIVEDMERHGIVRSSPTCTDIQTRPIITQGIDGLPDLYFPYESMGSLAEPSQTLSLSLPPATCLLDFAIAFKEKHPDAVMAKGSIQTHYCAWPMPSIKRMGKTQLNFATYEGHVYEWEAMPFDRPWSERAWQYYLDYYINSKYPFVKFYLTTFVICAPDRATVETNMNILYEDTEKKRWRVVMPEPGGWRSNIDELRLDETFRGIAPALSGGQRATNGTFKLPMR